MWMDQDNHILSVKTVLLLLIKQDVRDMYSAVYDHRTHGDKLFAVTLFWLGRVAIID